MTKEAVSECAMSAIAVYDANPEDHFQKYESLRFEDVHDDILDVIPKEPSDVLDVGAGSGRDAAALARRGHNVIAVEPSEAMREGARRLHREKSIIWLDDALPSLGSVKRLDRKFSLILLSAVWMHIEPCARDESMRSLTDLLAPGGRIVITLRQGSADPKRVIYAVSVQEVLTLAQRYGLTQMRVSSQADRLKREGVRWATLVLERSAPDAARTMVVP